jgi:hypothetical protein
MGLVDSYPSRRDIIERDRLQNIEMRCVEWRWRLKDRVHRLRQVHGDFTRGTSSFVTARILFCLIVHAASGVSRPMM